MSRGVKTVALLAVTCGGMFVAAPDTASAGGCNDAGSRGTGCQLRPGATGTVWAPNGLSSSHHAYGCSCDNCRPSCSGYGGASDSRLANRRDVARYSRRAGYRLASRDAGRGRQSRSRFTASHDVLRTSSSDHDVLRASGSDHNVLRAGGSDHDVLCASGSDHDVLCASGSDHDVLCASCARHDNCLAICD